MPTFTASTYFVAGSGTRISNFIVQGGLPSASGTFLSSGAIQGSTKESAFSGAQRTGKLQSFSGPDQDGFVIVASGEEVSATRDFLVFFPDFSRSIALFGVIGTSGTVEKFFDRSPFFFGSHEADPNTLRDLSEAQQFLIFTQANVAAFSNFRNTTGLTSLISTKGESFASGALFTNLVSNGGFETGALSPWEVYTQHSADSVSIRTSQPTSVGFNDGSPVSPPEGSHYLYTKKATTSGTLAVRQYIQLGRIYDSSVLETFSFKAIFDENSSSRESLVALNFLLADQKKHLIHYRFGSQGEPDFPTGLGLEDKDTSVSLSLTADVVNSYVRTINEDTSHSSFFFDEIEIWLINDTVNATSTDTLWDDFSLTADIPPEELLSTSDFAHVITTHPTASGFPFTISGSDNVLQVDLSPPFFAETSPVSGTTFNAQNSPVSFRVQDVSSAVDQGTINVWVDGLQVVTAGSPTTGGTWPTIVKTVLAPNDIKYDLTRSAPFPAQEVVQVSGTFADFASPANGAVQEYEFTIVGSGSLPATISGAADADPPVITQVTPADLSTNISPNTDLVWTLTDNSSGVDFTSVRLYINGVLRLNNDVALNGGFSRPANSSRGFDYTYTPGTPFTFGSTVTGTIEAADFVGNSTSTTYSFTVTAADTLTIENFFLADEESVLLTTGTLVTVDVVDYTYGVASGTTYLTLNGDTPAGLMTTLSGAGPDRLIFSFFLQPLVNFREDLEIVVHGENLFPGPYPVIQEQTFLLRAGYDVHWPNKSPAPAGGPETKFPYVTNIQVLTEAKNFAQNFGTGSAFYRFLTENLSHVDLGASLESNIKVADLSAALASLNPYFEYGKTMTLDLEVEDLEGNQLRFTHTFTIEPA